MKKWFTSGERHLIGASLARILVGAGGVHYYLSNYADRLFLFGPHGYITQSGAPSLYSFAHGRVTFDVLFHAGLIAALAFAICGGRALAATHAVLFTSIWARNPQLFDGGDVFGRIASVVLVLAVTDAYLSPFARQRRARAPGAWTTALHNTAIAILMVQIAIVYTSAGLLKLSDPLWRGGTALFRVAQLRDYRFVDWSGFVSSPFVVMPLTYGVMLFETTFVLAFRTRLRFVWVFALLAMHVINAATMGLVGFALHMAAGLAVCLSDDDYARMRRQAPLAIGLTRLRSGTDSAAGPRDAPRPRHRTAPPPASRRRERSTRRRLLRTQA